jgi:hypothetical protein
MTRKVKLNFRIKFRKFSTNDPGWQVCGIFKNQGGEVVNKYAYTSWGSIHQLGDTHHPALGIKNRYTTEGVEGTPSRQNTVHISDCWKTGS